MRNLGTIWAPKYQNLQLLRIYQNGDNAVFIRFFHALSFYESPNIIPFFICQVDREEQTEEGRKMALHCETARAMITYKKNLYLKIIYSESVSSSADTSILSLDSSISSSSKSSVCSVLSSSWKERVT